MGFGRGRPLGDINKPTTVYYFVSPGGRMEIPFRLEQYMDIIVYPIRPDDGRVVGMRKADTEERQVIVVAPEIKHSMIEQRLRELKFKIAILTDERRENIKEVKSWKVGKKGGGNDTEDGNSALLEKVGI